MPAFELTPDSLRVRFVEDIYSAEDLAPLPGGRWLATSGMAGPDCQGHLYAVDTERMEAIEIYPGGGGATVPDTETFGEVQPPDLDDFSAVGVGLRPGANDVHTLYVVNHGARSAIEVFTIDCRGESPSATWVGVIPHQETVWGNAVAPLADGGLVATNFMDSSDPGALDKVLAGERTGNVKEWHPDRGWSDVPGTECCSANGVDVSPDGRLCFVNSWATNRVIRVNRDDGPPQRAEVELPIMPDNVKWCPSGRVLVTGQESDAATVFEGVRSGPTYDVPLRVFALDPESMEPTELLRFAQPGGFGTAATAYEVGETIWVSSASSDRIAAFRPRESDA